MKSISLIVLLVFLSTWTEGKKCPGGVQTVIADSEEVKTLLSPGFPHQYEMNEKCMWGIQASDSDHDIQLTVVTMDLNDNNGDCTNDYLEIYEGDNIKTPRFVEKWCGQEKKMFKTRRRYVQLRFVSDGQFAGQGFAIEYGLVRSADLSCRGSTPAVIEVGPVPVVNMFQGHVEKDSCTWKIQTKEIDVNLVFEIYKPSKVDCNKRRYSFYEGDTISDHTSFEYCSNDKAFSKMFFSTGVVTIVFEHFTRDLDTDGLFLKMYTRPVNYNCFNVGSMPSIVVGESPVIFSLPFNMNSQSTTCSVQLQTMKEDKHLRLDVMGEDQSPASCQSEDLVSVIGLDSTDVIKQCNRRENPVFRGQSKMTITPTTQKKVFLRATAISSECNGHSTHLTAYSESVIDTSLPAEDKGYINLSQCKAVISASHRDELVHLVIRWKLPLRQNDHFSNTDVCEGDFVNVYDGETEDSNLIFSSCKRPEPGETAEANIVSTQRSLLVVLDADKRIEGESVQLEYNAVPGGKFCSGQDIIMVNTTKQMLTSLNYPGAMPLRQNCFYHLKAESDNDVIIVDIVESNMADNCGTSLTVYEGDYSLSSNDGKVKGRVCGQDKKMFRLKGHGVLYTRSGHDTGSGGWKAEVYVINASDSGSTLRLGTASVFLSILIAIFFTIFN